MNVQIPRRIIVHSMGEYIQDGKKTYSALDWLLHLGLSAHILVHPDGKKDRMKRDSQKAAHAKGFNTNSLGIEFLVPGVHNYDTFLHAIKEHYLTESAYQSGLEQIKEWMKVYNINVVDRHSDVDPERKKDPGTGFPWERLKEDL